MRLGGDDVAVRNGETQRIDIEDVVGGPLGLRIAVPTSRKRDPHVSTRHRIDQDPSGRWVAPDVLKLEITCGQSFHEHFIDLPEDVTPGDYVAQPAATPFGRGVKPRSLLTFLLRTLLSGSA